MSTITKINEKSLCGNCKYVVSFDEIIKNSKTSRRCT